MAELLHIRKVRQKLHALGCTCEKAHGSKWHVRHESEQGVTTFYIEVTHGGRTKRDLVPRGYYRKIQNKLGISRAQWDAL